MPAKRTPPDLAIRIPDLLVEHEAGLSGMAMALELRVPYPEVRKELMLLQRLGVVVRDQSGRTTRWILG